MIVFLWTFKGIWNLKIFQKFSMFKVASLSFFLIFSGCILWIQFVFNTFLLFLLLRIAFISKLSSLRSPGCGFGEWSLAGLDVSVVEVCYSGALTGAHQVGALTLHWLLYLLPFILPCVLPCDFRWGSFSFADIIFHLGNRFFLTILNALFFFFIYLLIIIARVF